MRELTVNFIREGKRVSVPAETTILEAAIAAGLEPNAPCGGAGTCGKCLMRVNGEELLACQTQISADTDVIREYAFYGNKTITSVTIPANVSSIGFNAFSW